MALAASIGDPPPIATTKSAPALFKSAMPSRMQGMPGLGVTRSNTVAACPFALRAESTSLSAPLKAELLPVTMSACLPRGANSAACSVTQFLPKTSLVGI